MKRSQFILSGVLGLLLAASALPLYGADNGAKGKEVTITGEAKCAKCALHQADKCQTVIQTEKDGKSILYYLADNDVAKGFHKEVCQDTKKVTATGTMKMDGDKHELVVSKIEAAK